MTEAKSELGVYVHWPYCARVCPYCDFNVYKNRNIETDVWINAFNNELEFWHEKTGPRVLKSIYFGGGTPSLAPPSIVEAVIEKCNALWTASNSVEVTLEANPTDAEIGRFERLGDIGVNRISLGIQSLEDEALKFLGRNHSAGDGRRALEVAQDTFANVTIDLIYARPGQELDKWGRELLSAIETGVGHLSLYQLTIEPGTPFANAVDRNRWTPPDSDLSADMFELTQDITAGAGLPAYEVSNHAKLGEESKHNQIYWRYEDYVGIGPGAHGRISIDNRKNASENVRKPIEYLAQVGSTGNGVNEFYALSDEDMLFERFAMGLRTTAGIPLYADDVFYKKDNRVDRLNALIENGLLTHNCGLLTASENGRRILDSILADLFC